MVFNSKAVLNDVFRKCGNYWPVLANLAGFAFGIYTAGISSFPFLSLMCGTVWNTVSIARVLCAVLLPFLITAIAVVLSKPSILYCLIFVRAFIRAFCLFGLVYAFGQAGWLVSILNLSVSSLVDWLITLFAFRQISGVSKTLAADFAT